MCAHLVFIVFTHAVFNENIFYELTAGVFDYRFV